MLIEPTIYTEGMDSPETALPSVKEARPNTRDIEGTLQSVGEQLNWCEPSYPVRLTDRLTKSGLLVRSMTLDDPALEEVRSYFITLSEGDQPIGLSQFSTPLDQRYRYYRERARSGSRHIFSDLPSQYLFTEYEDRQVQKYLAPFDQLFEHSNAAFEVSREYHGTGYGKLLLLMTQLMARERGIRSIEFRDDTTLKRRDQSFYAANADGSSYNGHTLISTEPTRKLMDFFEGRFEVEG